MIEYFESVKLRGTKSGKCVCGKRRSRAKTFEQTLSPYNKKDGRLKYRSEILDDLEIERDKWMERPVTCRVLTYWEMTKEQREEYDKEGFTMVEIECGSKIKRIKNL